MIQTQARRHLWALLAAAASLALMAGCSGGGEADSARSAATATGSSQGPAPVADPKTINVNIGAEPFSLDPHLGTDINGSKVLRHVHEGLTRLDDHAVPQPGLATHWESDETATTWTFHLRPDAKWSNGEPLTAEDFLWSFDRICDPATGAQYAYNVYNFVKGGRAHFEAGGNGVLGASAPDPHTLVIELEGPLAILPQMVAHASWYPVHRATVEEHGATWVNNPATYIGSGPFRMTEIRSKSHYAMERNPHYHAAGEVWFDKAVFKMIADPNTEIAAFERGELDITESVPLAELDRLRVTPEYYTSPWLGIYYAAFNLTRAPTDDVVVRRALSLAIPRNVITGRVTRRGEVPAHGFIPPGIDLEDGTSFHDLSGPYLDPLAEEANIAEAKRLLAEAGYGKGKPMPRVEYLYNNEAEEHAKIAQLVQNIWRTQLGVETNLKAVEFKVRQAMGQNQEFDVMRAGWIADYVDPITFLDIFTSDSGNNDGKMSNARYDELVREARNEPDRRRAFELMAEAERILVDEEVAIAPIYYYADPLLARTDIVGWHRNQLGDLDVSRARREP